MPGLGAYWRQALCVVRQLLAASHYRFDLKASFSTQDRWLVTGVDGSLRCRETQADVENVLAAIFVAQIFIGTSNASTVQPVVAVERAVFYR